MKASPSIGLMVTLMMFPQVVETIYSPALPHIAQGFGVATSTAAQTLSIYFIAFAIGVFFWGLLSDYIGRRRAMISGLVVYSLSVLCATMTESFDVLMTLRALSAFGAAVGSVVSQTMIRDAFTGSALGKVFAYMGIGISISPVVGMISGGILADHGGYPYVFTALSVLGFFLAGISLTTLAETMPDNYQKPKVLSTAKKLLTDACIWKNSLGS